MDKRSKKLAVGALQFVVIGIMVGCGGGPIRTGGMGIFAPERLLPDEKIQVDDLPPAVQRQVQAVLAGKTIKSVIRNVRPRDGRWYYTITYSDEADGIRQVSYWGNGTARPLDD